MLLKWSHTGLGSREDYTGNDPEYSRAYCRVLRAPAGHDPPWMWAASDGHVDLGTGYTATAKEAAEAAEAAYARARASLG